MTAMKSGKTNAQVNVQRAIRLISRGPQSTLFHLLFPLSLLLSFTVFYLIPLLASRWLEPSDATVAINTYLVWSVPIIIVATLAIYGATRRRMLAPYLKQAQE